LYQGQNVSAAITAITVTSPNGGETFRGTVPITWTVDGDTDTVNVYYSVDNFSSSWKIAGPISADTLNFDWDSTIIPNGATYKIKVRNTTDADIYDTSDATFTLDNTAWNAAVASVVTAEMADDDLSTQALIDDAQTADTTAD